MNKSWYPQNLSGDSVKPISQSQHLESSRPSFRALRLRGTDSSLTQHSLYFFWARFLDMGKCHGKEQGWLGVDHGYWERESSCLAQIISRHLHAFSAGGIGPFSGPRATIPQWLEWKPHYRKLIRMKNHRVMSQIKAQDKAPEKQLNEAEIVNLPVKEFRIIMVKIMIVKIIGSQK